MRQQREEPEQARTCKRPYGTDQAGQESIDPQRDPLKGESRYGEEAPTGKLHVVGGPAAAAGGEQAFRRAHGDFGQAGPGGRQGPACHPPQGGQGGARGGGTKVEDLKSCHKGKV